MLRINAEDQIITVSPAVSLLEVYRALPGALFPPFPPVELPGGVGGLVERGGFGQTSFFAADVLGATFLAPGGQAIRAGGQVVKNVQGYDLVRPLVGGYGSWGQLLEVTLRLRPASAAVFLKRQGDLDSVRPPLPRYLFAWGEEVFAFHFGHPLEIAAVAEAFGPAELSPPLDLSAAFPRLGPGPGPLKDLRGAWGDHHPPAPPAYWAKFCK